MHPAKLAAMSDHPVSGPPADRYVTFSDIDFAANMRDVLGHLRRYIDDPEKTNPFWERFKQRLAKAETDAVPAADKLLLMHAHVYYMRELFARGYEMARAGYPWIRGAP